MQGFLTCAVAAGLELRRIRNSCGLKPSQLARLAGHHSLALLLSSVRAQAGAEGGAAAGGTRPERRGERGGERGRERRSGRERRRPYVTQEAVLLALVQVRAACLCLLRLAPLKGESCKLP